MEFGYSPKPEVKKQELDFKQIFDERLASIAALPEEEQALAAAGLDKYGIQKIKREVPAIIFRPEEETKDWAIWIEDLENIARKHQPHHEERNLLCKALGIDPHEVPFLPSEVHAYILQDEKDQLWMLMDAITRYAADDIKRLGEYTDRSEYQEEVFRGMLELLKKYGISKIIGSTSTATKVGFDGLKEDSELIIDEDLIGTWRENTYFLNFGEKYGMTKTEFIKFKSFVSAANKAGEPVNYDSIAREIIEEREN